MSNTNTPNFPYKAPTDIVLSVASDDAFTSLSAGITDNDTTIPVVSTTSFNVPCLIVIESEIIMAGDKTANSFTNCTRGFGSTPAAHLGDLPVYGYIVAYHHNQVAAEIKSIGSWLHTNDLSGLKKSENLITYSEAFNNGAWAKTSGSTITSTSQTSPTGDSTACTLTEGSSNGMNGVSFTTSMTAGTPIVISCYAKYTNNPWIVIGQNITGETGRRAWFNLQTGATGTVGSSAKSTIIPLANGWYRCLIETTWTAQLAVSIDVALAPSDGTATYTGTSTKNVKIWGAQLEASSISGPLTYVKTQGATISFTAGGDLVLDEGGL